MRVGRMQYRVHAIDRFFLHRCSRCFFVIQIPPLKVLSTLSTYMSDLLVRNALCFSVVPPLPTITIEI